MSDQEGDVLVTSNIEYGEDSGGSDGDEEADNAMAGDTADVKTEVPTMFSLRASILVHRSAANGTDKYKVRTMW